MHSSLGVGSAIGLTSVRRKWRHSARSPLRSAVPIAPAAPVIRTRSVAGLIMGKSSNAYDAEGPDGTAPSPDPSRKGREKPT